MAIPGVGRCPVYEFKPLVSFGNDLLLPAPLYGIRVPPGLVGQVPGPDFVSPARMVSMLQAARGGPGGGLGVVHGLTKAEFSLRFSNPGQQWKQVRTGSGPPFWQFQGGDVFLEVEITVYVLDGDRPHPGDRISNRIFAIIVEHELLHVLDEIDLVSQWMPAQARQDEKVKKYLTNAEPVDDSMFRFWFQGRGLENWLRDGLWAPEHNARAAVRDSPGEYGRLQRAIDALRIQAINRPSR